MKNLLLSLAAALCCIATINAQVTVTCDGGSWQSEVSWTITNDATGEVLSGGAPYSGALNANDGDCFAVAMTDSYGDGWSGNTLTVGDFSTTLDSGASGTDNFCYSAPASCADTEYTWSMGGGSYVGETSFTVTDADGNVLKDENSETNL